MSLFNGTIRSLERSLDFSTIKNQVIANNIANVDTPNYKPKNVVFKNVLKETMNQSSKAKRTHRKHMPFNSAANQSLQIKTNNTTRYHHNGNNVDVDKEMTALANNQIFHQALVDQLNEKLGNIQTVIRGGS